MKGQDMDRHKKEMIDRCYVRRANAVRMSWAAMDQDKIAAQHRKRAEEDRIAKLAIKIARELEKERETE